VNVKDRISQLAITSDIDVVHEALPLLLDIVRTAEEYRSIVTEVKERGSSIRSLVDARRDMFKALETFGEIE
jgi:hypothetical protein